MRYNSYSEYLKKKYGGKVYKVPVNLPISCPNRDGNKGNGGCIFCAESGAAFEKVPSHVSIREQIDINMEFAKKRYKANRFIIYLQNFTNTYMPLSCFKKTVSELYADDVCAVYISTRPDCICDAYLDELKLLKEKYNYDICIELGLQSVNYKSLIEINRGHTLAEFIDAVITIKKYGFDICSHLILNLPWDNDTDIIECAKIISALKVDQVKLHSLYIPKDTQIASLYLKKEIDLGSLYEYVERVILFLEYLSPDIVVQRLLGRAETNSALFCNYGTSWWKIKDNILNEMEIRDIKQGDKYNYLNGSALKNVGFDIC